MVIAPVRTRLRLTRARFTGSTWTAVAAIVLAVIVLGALVGPLVYPIQPDQPDLLAVNAPPSAAHLLGTDQVGRDVLARLLSGSRISLLGPLVVALSSSVLGTIVAVSAAWIGGRFDAGIGVVIDIALSFPSILLAVLVTAFVGPGFLAPVVAISIAYAPYAARVVRAAALVERSLPYIEALQLQGVRAVVIAVRHLVPNMFGVLAALTTLTFGTAMVDLAAISFLGLGVQPPEADWGSMVADGLPELTSGSPQQSLAAGAAIVVTVIALNVLGEAIADRWSGRRA